ncbi:hypothetical protein LTR95_000556 [Oleoguttula sp. CCFEE 5521]
MTCRQIRVESLPMFYSFPLFYIEDPDGRDFHLDYTGEARRWIRAIGDENIRRLKEVTVHIEIPPVLRPEKRSKTDIYVHGAFRAADEQVRGSSVFDEVLRWITGIEKVEASDWYNDH